MQPLPKLCKVNQTSQKHQKVQAQTQPPPETNQTHPPLYNQQINQPEPGIKKRKKPKRTSLPDSPLKKKRQGLKMRGKCKRPH